MTDHVKARGTVLDAFKLVMGREATRPEAQCLHGVGMLETNCGNGWRGAGVGSHNWGAIQFGTKPPSLPGQAFLYQDTHPMPDGSSRAYSVYFKAYPDDVAGCADLARTMYKRRPTVLAAARQGNVLGVSTALYDTHYYEGFGKDRGARIHNHFKALWGCITRIAAALGEQPPGGVLISPPPALEVVREWPPQTLRRGSRGKAVADWQRKLGVVADGIFGPVTEQETEMWQTRHGLEPDGVVGPLTWHEAEKQIYAIG